MDGKEDERVNTDFKATKFGRCETNGTGCFRVPSRC